MGHSRHTRPVWPVERKEIIPQVQRIAGLRSPRELFRRELPDDPGCTAGRRDSRCKTQGHGMGIYRDRTGYGGKGPVRLRGPLPGKHQPRAGQETEVKCLPGRDDQDILCSGDQGIPGTGPPGRDRPGTLGERSATGLAPLPDRTGND